VAAPAGWAAGFGMGVAASFGAAGTAFGLGFSTPFMVAGGMDAYDMFGNLGQMSGVQRYEALGSLGAGLLAGGVGSATGFGAGRGATSAWLLSGSRANWLLSAGRGTMRSGILRSNLKYAYNTGAFFAGEATAMRGMESVPTRATHPNLYPDDPWTAVQRFELKQINGRWKTVDARGNAFTARGNYNYVVVGDRFYVTKVPSQPAMGQRVAGHIDIARGADVAYAGRIRFGAGRGNRGTLQWWDNSSGHYRPRAADASSISDLLPLDLFRGR